MSLTLAQALARVREQINEPTTAAWTDDSLRRWIMEAANDVARRTRCLRGSTTVTSVAGQADYTITTRLVEITHATYLGTGWSAPRPLTYVDLYTKSSFGYAAPIFPSFYTTWGEPPSMTLTLHPAPANSSETLTLYYYRLPAERSFTGSDDASSVEIPSGWEDCIYLYAEAMARRRDNDEGKWQAARQDYESKLIELNNVAMRYNDQAGSIIDDWTVNDWQFGPYGRGR